MRSARDDAFEQFVRARRRALVGFAYALTRDVAAAEDLAAEALARTWVRPRVRNRPERELELYVRRVIVNLAIARHRRRQVELRHRPVARDDWRVVSETAERYDLSGVEAADLLAALAALPLDERTVLTWRFLLDMSGAETAAALGVPVGTVKSRVARACVHLRVELERRRSAERDFEVDTT